MNFHFRSRRSLAINSVVDLVRAPWLLVMVVLLLALTARPSAAINFPCNITLNPPTATLGVAGSSQGATKQDVTATVTKQSDGSAVQGAQVSFSTTSGSLLPTSQNTGANGHATSTFTSGATAGTATLTATVSWEADPAHNVPASSLSANATFTIIDGDPSANGATLRHYCGVDVSSFNTTTSAPSQPTGTTWTWATSSAMAAKDASQGTTPKAILTGVQGTSSLNGRGSEWVQITYTFNGVSVTSNKEDGWTVLRPGGLKQISLVDQDINTFAVQQGEAPPNCSGYVSVYQYDLQDQFGQSMPNVDVNEQFGTVTVDYAGANWPPIQQAQNTSDEHGYINDAIGFWGHSPAYSRCG